MLPFQTHAINRNSSLVESDTISRHQILGNAVVSSCVYTACCTDVVFRIPFQSPSSICCSQECGRLPVPGGKGPQTQEILNYLQSYMGLARWLQLYFPILFWENKLRAHSNITSIALSGFIQHHGHQRRVADWLRCGLAQARLLQAHLCHWRSLPPSVPAVGMEFLYLVTLYKELKVNTDVTFSIWSV